MQKFRRITATYRSTRFKNFKVSFDVDIDNYNALTIPEWMEALDQRLATTQTDPESYVLMYFAVMDETIP